MGKIEQHNDTVDHTVAQSYQSVYAAKLQAVDQLRNDKHKIDPSFPVFIYDRDV